MKRTADIVLVAVFIVTLGVLGMHSFEQVPGASAVARSSGDTLRGVYRIVTGVPLGAVEVSNYRKMAFTKGIIRFSPDSKHLAVGTENGDILLLSTDGQLIWRKNIGLGKISAMDFAAEGQLLLIGETSQQGGLLGLDVKQGKEVWRYSCVEELGAGLKDKTYPGIVAVKTAESGEIYAVGLRFILQSDGISEYRGRIYKFSPEGKRVAVFPSNDNLDTWVSWLSVDKRAEKVVFGTGQWSTGATAKYADTMYCLEGSLGRILWSKLLPSIPPYKNPTMRYGPEISADASRIAGIVNDGRGFLYDHNGDELWVRSLSRPQKVGGVFINATGVHVKLIDPYVLFTTGNTYNRANWQIPTPVEHPSSNSLFVFDSEGQLISRSAQGGIIEEVSAHKHTLSVAIGRNIRTKDPSVHGLYILSLPDQELIDRLKTAGPCISSAISNDGEFAAVIEAPLQLDDGSIVGDYWLWLLEKTKEGGDTDG